MLPRKIFVVLVLVVLLVVRLVVDAIIARTVLRFGPALKLGTELQQQQQHSSRLGNGSANLDGPQALSGSEPTIRS